jgi:hypothetical protein
MFVFRSFSDDDVLSANIDEDEGVKRVNEAGA